MSKGVKNKYKSKKKGSKMLRNTMLGILILTSILATLKVSGVFEIGWLVVFLPIVIPTSMILILIFAVFFFVVLPFFVRKVRQELNLKYYGERHKNGKG